MDLALVLSSSRTHVITALTLHYRIMLRKIARKLMIKPAEFAVKGGRLLANTINGDGMQTLQNTCHIWNSVARCANH